MQTSRSHPILRTLVLAALIGGGFLIAVARAAAGEAAATETPAENTTADDAGLKDTPRELEHPSWNQLMNGSLDQHWVEIRGIIEALLNRANGWSRIDLRTRDGVVKIELRREGLKSCPLEQYENAVIRLRGRVFTAYDIATKRVKVRQYRMHDAEILVDQPAPADLFSIPRRTTASLVRLDPGYDEFSRVKIAGQIVFVRDGTYFMMDGADGLRFIPSKPLSLELGDLVEVVGFPELSGASPVLRGAVVRKTGHAALPEPKRLAPEDLIRPTLDAIRVRVEASLQSLRQTPTNLVLEMQAGSWRFLARLQAGEQSVPSLQLGSKLDLTGVYCAQGGYKALGEDVAAVDLLLNSPADIRILTTPPWWTLERLLVVAGILACLLVAMVLWVTQLSRKVEQRTVELRVQIQNRERAEHQRSLEQERARIARDLHDELGADITEIGMLAMRTKSATVSDEERHRCLEQVAGKTGQMVSTLEEIVWAMNPQHDSLASLVSYFSFYADRFLALANIKLQIEQSTGTANPAVDTRLRHQLFLVFKEALANVVNHSGATEVRVGIRAEPPELRLTVADNGRGLTAVPRADGRDGLANMRVRIEKIGGRFDIASEPGRGTTLTFALRTD